MTTPPTVGPEVDGEVTRKPRPHTTTPSSVEQVSENKVDKLEMAELQRIIESSKTPTTPEPEDYLSNRVGFVLILMDAS
ncbi:hypothetical protein OESDEN_16550 [Oesophagostomum dentatum]|uniref:Uncharacterized protein n=1 Tax=Oesophagostomum dentatum TaxID=61180 RepID=A0A0B1SEL6_OESDE|nr:hypothetical protein OESDEN_16550 [Oesophagostomum dentatum]